MAINFRGYVFDDAGSAVSGATVQLLETGTSTEEASTTTNSSGLWSFSEADQDRYDIKVTSGASVRYRNWDDQIQLKEIDVRNSTGNTTPALTLTNITNNAANIVGKFGGANTTRADNDEIYFTFELANSAGQLTEYGRMTIVATDVTDGEEDGQFEFDVMKSGTLTKAFTIASSTSGAQSIDFNQDAITFGTATDGTDVSLTFDGHAGDGVITWMEDEDYFKFSDDILMNSTERINFYDTAIYIYSSADGQLDLVADTEIQIAATTVDLNGNLDVSGTYTGAGLMTTGGNIVIPNAGNIGSASDTDSIAISSAGVVTMNQIPVFSAGINVSGGTIAGTLATAAQTAITSVGTLTALTVDDVAVNGKVVTMTGSTSDTAVFTVGTHGTLSIVTTDDAAAAANIQITADGTVDIDSAGVLTLDSGAAINIEPASGSAILLDGTISIDAGVVTGATSITSTAFVGDITGDVTGTADVATVATTVTITDNESTNEDNAIIFTAGGDVNGGNIGLESDGTLTYNPSTGKITATGFIGALTGAVTGDVTGTADVATVATTVTITDNESTNEDNAIIFTAGGDVNGGNIGLESDGTLTYNPSTGKVTATGFIGALTGDVTGNVTGNTSGTAATVTTAAQSAITSLGTLTTLTVDNIIINGTNIGHTSDTDSIAIASGGDVTFSQDVVLGEAASVNISTPLLPSADHTYSGTTAQMLAGGAISAFDLVCINNTTGEVIEADASASGTARVIGIAPAAISDTATGTVLVHGFIRDDSWNWTTGSVLFLSETAGAMTHTAPTTSGAFVQAVGIALSPDVVFINPSLDLIEHA